MSAVVSPTGLLPVVLDPDTSTELNLNDGEGYIVHADMSFPLPAAKPVLASSIDTEGALAVPDSIHYDNREIGFKVRVYGSTDEQVEDRLNRLADRVAHVHRNGGVLGVTTPGGATIFFDLVGEFDADAEFGEPWLRLNKTDVEIRLQALPYWRAEEEFVGTFAQTVGRPVLDFVTEAIAGNVPALGRLVIRDQVGADRFTVVIGSQSTNYSPDANKALYYTGEQFTPLGSSTTPGFGVIFRGDLGPVAQAILSSRLVTTDTHLGHHGNYRVWAILTRPTTNTGVVTVQLEWAEGDFKRRNQNPSVTFNANDREGVLTYTDLGAVSITPEAERWEFRLTASSTVLGDDINVAAFMLFPTDDTYIKLSGQRLIIVPSAFTALDYFDQTAGALAGKTMTQGGTWGAGGSDPTDFTVNATTHAAERSEGNDANQVLGGRAALVSGSFTDQAVQVASTVNYTGAGAAGANQTTMRGFAMRYLGTSNGMQAGILETAGVASTDARAYIAIRVGGVDLAILDQPLPVGIAPFRGTSSPSIPMGTPIGMYCRADSSGLVQLSIWIADLTHFTTWYAWHQDLATGGALASGQMGIYDGHVGAAGDFTRVYDYFGAYIPTKDAALFSNQSLELTHNSATRYDEGGLAKSKVSIRRGNYFKPKPGQNRLLVVPMRNDPDLATNAAPNDVVEADLYVAKRGLIVPGLE